jgi:hypothetical protein
MATTTTWGNEWKKPLQDPLLGSIRNVADWPYVTALAEIAKEHYSEGWAYSQREMAQVLPGLNFAGELKYGSTEIGLECDDSR